MNDLIKQFVEQAGGDFWQRIESDGVLNKEAYITFDPPENLAKFVELIVRECCVVMFADPRLGDVRTATRGCARSIKEHFGVEE